MILKKSSFNPSQLSGCKFWIDTSDTSSMKCNLSRQFLGNQYIGTDSYATGANFFGLTAYSFAVWITPYMIDPGTTSLLSIMNTGTATPILGWLRLINGAPSFYVSDNVAQDSNALGSALSVNQMYCLVGTRNGDLINLYRNTTSSFGSVPPGGIGSIGGCTSLNIGASVNGSAVRTNFFSGMIHGACIWNKTLNQAEVNSFYNGGTPLKCSQLTGTLASNLLEYWSLGEPSGVALNQKTNTNLSATNNPIANFGPLKDIYVGCGVTSIANKAGNSHIAQVAGSGINAPVYAIMTGVNLPYLRFNNSNLAINGITGVFNSRKYSLVSAHMPFATNGFQTLVSASNTNGDYLSVNAIGANSISGHFKFGTTNTAIAGGASYDGPCLLYQSNTTGAVRMYANANNFNGINFNMPETNMNTVTIGAVNTGSLFNVYNGALHELAIYDGEMTNIKRDQVLTYYGKKWNMTPLLYPGLSVWVDAKDHRFLIMNGSNVTGVKNKVFGPTISYSNGNPIVYTTDNYLRFTKSCFMVSGITFSSGTNFAIFRHIKLTGPIGFNDVVGSFGDNAVVNPGFYEVYPTSADRYDARLKNGVSFTSVYATGIDKGYPLRNITFMTVGTNKYIAINNGITGLTKNVGYNNPSTNYYLIGGYGIADINNSFSGHLGTFIAYKTGLSTNDANAINYYLSRHWNTNIY